MKKILLSAMIVATMISAKAQYHGEEAPFKLNGGVELALPTGDLGNLSSIGFGVSLLAEYAATEQTGITLSAGFLSFSGKSVSIDGLGSAKSPSISDIPVLVGTKIHFSEKVYGHLQAGLSFFNNGLGSAFTYAPAIGVMASEKIDVALKYQAATKNGGSISFLGVRAAYTF